MSKNQRNEHSKHAELSMTYAEVQRQVELERLQAGHMDMVGEFAAFDANMSELYGRRDVLLDRRQATEVQIDELRGVIPTKDEIEENASFVADKKLDDRRNAADNLNANRKAADVKAAEDAKEEAPKEADKPAPEPLSAVEEIAARRDSKVDRIKNGSPTRKKLGQLAVSPIRKARELRKRSKSRRLQTARREATGETILAKTYQEELVTLTQAAEGIRAEVTPKIKSKEADLEIINDSIRDVEQWIKALENIRESRMEELHSANNQVEANRERALDKAQIAKRAKRTGGRSFREARRAIRNTR